MKMISYKKKLWRYLQEEEGFTLVELIVASLISIAVLTASYSLIRMISTINKSDEIALKLSGKMDNALDFVVDEINSSKRVLTSISQQPKSCNRPPGEFVIGLSLPDQALDVSAYQKTNKNKTQFLRTQVNCPVIYTLVKNNNYSGQRGSSYKLMRRGPALNKEGYYIPTKVNDTLVADRIRYSPIDSMSCSPGWTKRTIKGIITCTDKYRRSAEIGISAETNKNYAKYNFLSKTSAGFSKIQDDDLMETGKANKKIAPCSISSKCNIFGTQITSRKITFHVDISSSMNRGKLKGKTPLIAVKEELIKSIQSLENGVFYQIVAFADYSEKLFKAGPQKVTPSSRIKGIEWVRNLRADGYTKPWSGLFESLESQSVGQIILLSDGHPTRTSGWCKYYGGYMSYADCFKYYNENVRAKTTTGKVKVDTISVRFNFCAKYGGDHPRLGDGWMGDLSSKNNGNCSVIR